MKNKIRNKPHLPTIKKRQCSAGNDIKESGAAMQRATDELPGRRSFLKHAGIFSAGLVSGPTLLQGCGGGGGSQAQAAETILTGNPDPLIEPVPTIPIQPAVESSPVLQFNDADSSHLLSIDLRSEDGLLALNDIYGAGTYTPVGSLIFDARRGVAAVDVTSGLEIDLSKILDADVRLGLAEEGQLMVEFESNRIADPWLVNEYTDRYQLARNDASQIPASAGLPPFSDQASIWRLFAEDGVGGPSIFGPAPESPSGLGTRANNLSIRLRDSSLQDMRIGIHSAVHDEFCAVTTAWWAPNRFTVYVDGIPEFLAGPAAVTPRGEPVEQAAYLMTDAQSSTTPKRLLRLFFGRSGVNIRRLILGAQAPELPVHPLFRECASYGDSFTHRGGFANSRVPVSDLWDAHNIYYFLRNLASNGYRMGWCWNNSLGGGSFLKTATNSLWDNGGQWDLESLKSINPSFVMTAASHNDAAYIGRGGSAETTEYQQRLAEIKADFLEHIEVILTGRSQNWSKVTTAGDAKIGIISAPISPSGPGWGESQAQAQRDLNDFVLREVPDWVVSNLGEAFADRIATFDVASLFGPQYLVEYHPLFESNGTGVHPNWWGGDLLNFGWWQCALKLINGVGAA